MTTAEITITFNSYDELETWVREQSKLRKAVAQPAPALPAPNLAGGPRPAPTTKAPAGVDDPAF